MDEFRDDELGRFETLVKVVDRLRSPGGCPWDREQTASSLRQFVIEEAYEVIEAIDSGAPEKLREELGDLLLQVVLQARIAAEGELFDIERVVRGINEKLIRRHRWVFGDEEAESPAAALRSWNRVKIDERGGVENGASILDGVPKAQPALQKAFSITRRAAQVGFDWKEAGDLVGKLREELGELEESLGSGRDRDTEEEIGDILFVLANVARHLGVNPELALEKANRKFIRRFRHIEERLAESNSSPDKSSLEEMDRLWDEAKELEE